MRAGAVNGVRVAESRDFVVVVGRDCEGCEVSRNLGDMAGVDIVMLLE